VKTLPGLRALLDDVDDLLVDLWGVVHDGDRPYDGVVDALERIAALPDRRVLFLSNTSRSKASVVSTLVASMGIERRLFFDVVTSGDVTRDALIARDPAVFAALPAAPRAFHQGDAAFVPWLFEPAVPLRWTSRLDEADLVVATGSSASPAILDAALAALAPAAARGVPLVCTNPDRTIPRPRGPEGIGPGAIAHGYAAMGGRVVLYGKPHAPIYAEARRRLGAADRRVIAVGDLIETDIRGAAAASIPSVLVTRGREERAWRVDDVQPDHVIERFAW
jgi:HAD superfamily hydrolase (TIGR01459 family)